MLEMVLCGAASLGMPAGLPEYCMGQQCLPITDLVVSAGPNHTSIDCYVVNMQATVQWIGIWRANVAPPNAARSCFRPVALLDVRDGNAALQAWSCLQAFLNSLWQRS